MKNLADFKRAMQIGSRWDSCYIPTGTVMTNRTCVKRQSNSFALTIIKKDGTTDKSWCNWPKANACHFSDDGKTITIAISQVPPRKENEQELPRAVITPLLTYTLLEEAPI